MKQTARDALLDRWFRKSSDAEEERMDRAERMVRKAIENHEAFRDTPMEVYVKGSYANETNVRSDSDVDVVVENHDLFYYDYMVDAPQPDQLAWPYKGHWTPASWRREVTKALEAEFSASDIDATGKVAITLREVPGSRPSADVVPAFNYYRFDTADRRISHNGSRVYTKEMQAITNYPQQQLLNGRTKNQQTSGRYKRYVRALKNAENALADEGMIDELPSYFMECLMWNVPGQVMLQGDIYEGFLRSVLHLIDHLSEDNFCTEDWAEPNDLKWLFPGQADWSRQDGRRLALLTFDHLWVES